MVLQYHNTSTVEKTVSTRAAIMSGILKISEAVSLALHGSVLLASQDRALSNKQIAHVLHASEAHLHKVMRRLAAAGILLSTPGPGGGFSLAKPPKKITLLNIYEAVEGPLGETRCLLTVPLCDGKACILGGLIHQTNQAVRNYLQNTTLAQVAGVFKGVEIES